MKKDMRIFVEIAYPCFSIIYSNRLISIPIHFASLGKKHISY